MSFNMADLLAPKPTVKRTLTPISDSEMEGNSCKRTKPDSSAPTDQTPVTAQHHFDNDVSEEALRIQHMTTTSPPGEQKSIDDQQKKRPYGGRPLKFKCQHCDRRFHAPSHLKRHVMSHSSERPFRCEICDKGFLQAWHLGRHMTTHTGNKPFHCSECPRSFGSRFEMKTHINYIHKGIKEHQCNVCGKFFTLRSNLKVHMRKHTGEKPYKCTYCGKRFGQRGHLQYHVRKHAASTEQSSSNVASTTAATQSNHDNVENSTAKYVSRSAVVIAAESDKDSGVDSCDSQSTTSSCSSPSVKDLEDHSDIKGAKNQTSEVNAYFPRYSPTQYFEDLRQPSLPSIFLKRQPSPSSLYVKQFVCDICNCGFESMPSLKAHVRHSHSRKGISVGRYKCAICLQAFESIEALQSHALAGHQIPAKRTTIMFPSSSKMEKEAARVDRGQSENSLAFSVERLCQTAELVVTREHPCCEYPYDHVTSSVGFRPQYASVIQRRCSDDIRLMRLPRENFFLIEEARRPHSY